MLGLVL